MELDDMLSDLISLRKLYGLLQTNKDGQQIADFKNLDDKALNLLKNLLDDAAAKIFETHSKTVATPAIEHNTPCAAQPWQPKPMPKLRPVSLGISENFPDVAENHIKGLNPGTDFLQKDELSAANPVPQDTISELSRHSASIHKPALRRKRGWVQSQSNFTHPNSAKEMKLCGWNSSSVDRFQLSRFNWDNDQPKGSESREKFMGFGKNHNFSGEPDSKTHQNRSSVKSIRCSSSNLAADAIQSGETAVKVEAGYIPKEAAKPIIEQIESHLSSVQLGDSTMVTPASRGQSPNPFLLRKKSVIKEGEKTQEGWNHHHPSPIGNAMLGHEHCQKCGKKKSFKLRGQTQSEVPASLPSQNESWIPSHNLRETMDGNIQQTSSSLNQDDDYSIVNGLRFLHTQTGKVNQVLGGMGLKGPNRMAVASQPAVPCSSVDSGDNISRRHTKALHRGRGPSWTKTQEAASGETVQGSPQLDNHRPNKISTPPITYKEAAAAAGERRGPHKHSKMGRQKQGPPSRHVWGTSRSSNGSSSWESEAWSTSGGSNSELYSCSTWQSSSRSDNSNSESYSDTYSSRASEGKNDSSSSEVVEEHSRSRRMESRPVAPRARSVVREENKLHLSGTTNNKKTTHKAAKGMGRFKKFKDKLALIFHHHHHHHHHHHRRSDDNDDREGSSDTAGTTDGNNKAYEEQVVEEVRRRAVGGKAGRRKQGQLQALVGGLVKHVRKSKKPKRDKAGGIGQQLGKAGGHGKLGKKIKWWQKLRPPGGRVKLPSGKGKSHVKLGFKKSKNKKPS